MAQRAKVNSVALTFSSAVLLFIASSFAAQNKSGVLEIHVKDHRDAIGDFAKLDIVIDKISLSPKAGFKFWQTGWRDLPANPDTVDLTQYIGKNRARVYRGPIEAGSFEGFHLKIKRIDGILNKDQHRAAIKNLIGTVKLPLEVRPGGETLLIIDLTVGDFTDHPPRGYELSLQGYEVFTNGKLTARIPPR